MSIEDKTQNDNPEEDTVALRAVSGGNRKSKKQKQTRTSDKSPNTPADETKRKSNGTERKVAPQPVDKAREDTPISIATKSVEEKEQVKESAASIAGKSSVEQAAPIVPESPQAKEKEQHTPVEKEQPVIREPSAPVAPKLPLKEEAAPVVPKSSPAREQAAPVVPQAPRLKEEAEPVVPKSSAREASAPAIPKRPQAKGQGAPAIPKRPQSREQAAVVPQTPRLKEKADAKPPAREEVAPVVPKTPQIKEQPASVGSEKHIADISTTALSKQEVEEQLAAARAKKDIAELPTTAVPGQKAPASSEKHIADISTTAISKQEVQEQLAAAKAKKELAEKAGRVLPERKKDQKKDIADQPTTAFPGQKAKELPVTPLPEKHIADVSTTAISKQEVEEQLAAARAKKEAKRQPVAPKADSKTSTATSKMPYKAVAVLSRNPMFPAIVAPSRLDPGTQHRIRVNRMLMRKRRHERTKEIAPRLVIVVAAILILLISLLSSGTGAAYAYYQAQLPLLNGIAAHSLFQTTHIYDRNGKLLYELYDQQLGRGRRTYVNYNDISPLLVDATVAIEDRTFWTNNGVDPVGIARASFLLAQNNGDVQGGGSTVTQQLIKNQFFDNQPRTFQLKGEEAMLAAGLTQQYPKWKIMEMYLNTVYYGNINYGAEAAAEDYFGLMPKCDKARCVPGVGQLDLAQASMLAGLPQSPTNYDPITNKSVALARQKAVLQALVETGKITQVQAQQAANEMAKYNFISHAAQRRGNSQAPHFVSYVIDQLTNLLGAQTLVSGGFNVYTTIDLDLEKKVEQIVYNHLYQQQNDNYVGFYGILSRDKNVNNGAVVVMNPYNGEILAMDGSANYNANNPTINGQVNATVTARQPGSSMKPIIYATAFDMGWSPGMIVPDHKTIYPYPDPAPPQYYTPQNYDQTFHTSFPMTIRTAVSNSYNIPALDTLMYAGIPNVLNMAGRLGLPEIASVRPSQVGVSLALGAKEVSLLHMTNAYGTFANQGVRVPPVSILEITDNQGHPLYKYDAAHPQGIRAVGAGVAFMINSMLSDKQARYHEFSPGNPLELDRPAAAKTGTTDSFKDNWTMGYTPHLAVGVWVGNSNNVEMNNIIGITGAGPIWHDVMEYASQRYNLPPDDFIKPNNVHAGIVSAVTGLVPRSGESTVTDWYIDGTLPTIQGSNYSSPSSCTKKHCKNNHNNNNNGG
jgi:membrane peptidoglycan carboxypeptidase